MADTITSSEDYLDSRDIEERLKFLENESDLDANSVHEQRTLQNLKEQYVDSFGADSWEFGAQFIRYDNMEDYAQELANDIGVIHGDLQWPLNCIDWEQAARELAMDYTEFDFDGVEYLAREA